MRTAARGVACAAVVGLCAAIAGPAQAQQSQAWTWCVNKEKASPDLQISGCTTVIQSGKESPKNLSIAFNNRGNGYRAKDDNDRAIAPYNGRGNAYRAKGDNDRALADSNMSIKLDPKYASPHNGRGNVYRTKGDND